MDGARVYPSSPNLAFRLLRLALPCFGLLCFIFALAFAFAFALALALALALAIAIALALYFPCP
jgi:hypothetical protein